MCVQAERAALPLTQHTTDSHDKEESLFWSESCQNTAYTAEPYQNIEKSEGE